MKIKRKSISPAMRKRVLERDGHKCIKCKDTDGPFELDHVIAVEKFGAHHDDNLVTLCKGCHRFKTNRDRQDIRKQKRLERARMALVDGVPKPERRGGSKMKSRGFQKGLWKRKLSGEVVRRG